MHRTATALVEAQWIAFLREVRIVAAPVSVLAVTAWDCAAGHCVAAPDGWFVACALHLEAELWMSRPPLDWAGTHAAALGIDDHYLSQETSRV
jgi:hypothetical protein